MYVLGRMRMEGCPRKSCLVRWKGRGRGMGQRGDGEM